MALSETINKPVLTVSTVGTSILDACARLAPELKNLKASGCAADVVSTSGVPESGAPLRVKGRVNAPIELGVVTIGTHVAEDSREAP